MHLYFQEENEIKSMYQRPLEMHFMWHHKGNPCLNTQTQESMQYRVWGATTGLSEKRNGGPREAERG